MAVRSSESLKLYARYNYIKNITDETMRAKVRKWGSSLGIVIPKEVAEAKGVRPGDEVVADIEKISDVKEIFGLLKGWKRPTQQIKEEARRGWE